MLDSSFTTTERQVIVDVLEDLRRLTPKNVWTTASDVTRRASIPYGGSPARVFVMAHERARCHRSQEPGGLTGGRNGYRTGMGSSSA